MSDLEILEQQAIDAAMSSQWNDAVNINKKISKLEKNNVGAYLRLGFAYIQLHKLDEAKKSYRKVLRLQAGNQLARENLERIKVLETKGRKKPMKKAIILDPNLFLEVPGKTKNAALVNLGQKNTLALLIIGQNVILKPKKRKIEVRTDTNEYIGSLPDDLSKRLFLFIKAESVYSAYVKEVSLNRVAIFIREEKKGKRVARFSSFPKDIQVDMSKFNTHDLAHAEEEGDEEVVESDLEKIAEEISNDERDYHLIYHQEGSHEDEENLEE
ncbi:tetratricopeptide repeat protein [Candidatus Roizmanbacteria bacterium]|nr:tetratricopeptide repeat protein [Candidatus Roizmanbacteria bacterium]